VLKHHEGKIGEVRIASLLDFTILAETAQSWFPDFERAAVRPHEHWLCPLHYDAETGRIPMPVQSFVLQTKHHVVLIDTCVGNDKDRPMIGEMHKLNTDYLGRLSALGLRPEDVDFVMCTHLHVDHVGWNTRLVDGRWVPTFPNARYIMSKRELDAARAEAKSTPIAALRNCFEDSVAPIVAAGKADLIDGVHQMLDEFTLRPAPGHSPGHVRIELRSGNELGVFAGDLLHSPIQVPFWKWSSKVCWNREMAAQARRELLEFCVADGALLIPGHFQAPHVARVREKGDSFALTFGW
jgi:glyoxylase-like metal-dependent hydrolase (beta-lactamase superfamily II)